MQFKILYKKSMDPGYQADSDSSMELLKKKGLINEDGIVNEAVKQVAMHTIIPDKHPIHTYYKYPNVTFIQVVPTVK